MTIAKQLAAREDDVLMAKLRRHVGHVLRCVRNTSGELEGYIVETISLRCEDCGEIALESHRVLNRKRRSRR